MQNYWLKTFQLPKGTLQKKKSQYHCGRTGEGACLANDKNKVFANKIIKEKGRQEVPIDYVLNNHAKSPTGIIASKMSTLLEELNLLPAQQKVCHAGSKCCKDQLIISTAIYEDCKRRNKNLSIIWKDHQKALHSVPHSWVEK
jgi:hypothetical protein